MPQSSGYGSVELGTIAPVEWQHTVYVFVGHGSRDPATHLEFESFVDGFKKTSQTPRQMQSGGSKAALAGVEFGYMELAEPAIADVLERIGATPGVKRVVVIPISLFSAGHIKNEMPLHLAAAKQNFPHIDWVITRPLGLDPLMVDAVSHVVSEATRSSLLAKEREVSSALVVVGRGTSDPDANSEFYKVGRLIAEKLQILAFYPSFIGVTGPSMQDVLRLASQGRIKELLVVPYFLFRGVLYRRIEAQVAEFAAAHPWLNVCVSRPLGAVDHPESIYKLIHQRVHEALFGGEPLPCTHCKYRVPLDQVAGNVAGLDALLYSVRHSLTHKQAVNHGHAPIKKHILICSNVECVQKGAALLVPKLRRVARRLGYGKELKITKTSCLGRCGEGPNVVVYPDGIWYRDFTEEFIELLFSEHLQKGKILTDKVDLMM